MQVKYVRSSDDRIVVFGGAFQHSDFRYLEPKSAGFISIGAKGKNDPDCTCFGESFSLNLKSLKDDTRLARRQILGYDYDDDDED